MVIALSCVCLIIDRRRRQNVVAERTYISDTLGYRLVCHFFFILPHFDVICDLLLNRRMATWNPFVKSTTIRVITILWPNSCLLARTTLCKGATFRRQTFLSKTFANSLNMQKQYEKVFRKRVMTRSCCR